MSRRKSRQDQPPAGGGVTLHAPLRVLMGALKVLRYPEQGGMDVRAGEDHWLMSWDGTRREVVVRRRRDFAAWSRWCRRMETLVADLARARGDVAPDVDVSRLGAIEHAEYRQRFDAAQQRLAEAEAAKEAWQAQEPAVLDEVTRLPGDLDAWGVLTFGPAAVDEPSPVAEDSSSGTVPAAVDEPVDDEDDGQTFEVVGAADDLA